MQKKLIRKGFVIGILALFLGAGVVSGIGYDFKDQGDKTDINVNNNIQVEDLLGSPMRSSVNSYTYYYTENGGNVWDGDFSKQHTPAWWENLFRDSRLLEVLECGELEDSGILLEDAVLYDIEHNIDLDNAKRYIDQIVYGFEHSPHQSIFIITGRKR